MPPTAGELLKEAAGVLRSAGIGASLAEAEWLLETYLETDRTSLYLNRQEPVDENRCRAVREAAARRCTGEPLQYIIGELPFAGVRLKIRKGVFIPRPETEELAAEMVRRLAGVSGPAVDFCAGSGALGVALAFHCPALRVTAVDISSVAVEAVRENAGLNGTADRIEAVQADFRQYRPAGEPTAVVSNPPYIPTGDIPGLQAEVKDYDPHTALDGGADGLVFYRDLAAWCMEYLAPAGLLGLEIGHGQGAEVKNILAKTGGFSDIECRNDLNGLERMVFARRQA